MPNNTAMNDGLLSIKKKKNKIKINMKITFYSFIGCIRYYRKPF